MSNIKHRSKTTTTTVTKKRTKIHSFLSPSKQKGNIHVLIKYKHRHGAWGYHAVTNYSSKRLTSLIGQRRKEVLSWWYERLFINRYILLPLLLYRDDGNMWETQYNTSICSISDCNSVFIKILGSPDNTYTHALIYSHHSFFSLWIFSILPLHRYFISCVLWQFYNKGKMSILSFRGIKCQQEV